MNKKGNTLSWFWRYRRLYWLHFMFCLVSRGATFSRLTTNWFCVWNVPFRDEDFLRIAIVRQRICLNYCPPSSFVRRRGFVRSVISLQEVFVWYFIIKNEISFLSKWPKWTENLNHVNSYKKLTRHRNENISIRPKWNLM